MFVSVTALYLIHKWHNKQNITYALFQWAIKWNVEIVDNTEESGCKSKHITHTNMTYGNILHKKKKQCQANNLWHAKLNNSLEKFIYIVVSGIIDSLSASRIALVMYLCKWQQFLKTSISKIPIMLLWMGCYLENISTMIGCSKATESVNTC